jgi:hypothetical protein
MKTNFQVKDRMNKFLIYIIVIIAGLFFVIWLGVKINPKPFSPFPEKSGEINTFPMPEDLPIPVERFYRTIYDDKLPEINSFVLTGRGKLRFQGVTLPAKLRFSHQAGKNYRHYIETTFWGLPILKVNEHFIAGESRLALPFGVIENEPQVDQAANLGLWSETLMLPSIYLSTIGVRWEEIDDSTARLIVPFEDEQDEFIVYFNQKTGLVDWMEAMRWKNAGDAEKTRWQAQALEWGSVQGWQMPTLFAAQWMDEDTPWLMATIEDVTLNVDLSQYITGQGE